MSNYGLIENAQRHFQGSLLGCFEYVPYTALNIVCTINVSIDCKKNKVFILFDTFLPKIPIAPCYCQMMG